MVNPNDSKQAKRLCDAIRKSRQGLSVFRENRLNAIRQYVGSHYSNDGAEDKVPINLLEMAVSIYSYQLVSQNPRVLCATQFNEVKPYADAMSKGLNYRLEQMDFATTLRRCVIDALFCMGIMKTALANSAEVMIEGLVHSVAQEFSDAVDLDDWVHDTEARHYEEVSYAGNKFRIPLEMAKELYPKQIDSIKGGRKDIGSADRSDSASGVGGKMDSMDGDYHEYVDLWEIWLPQENLIVTLPVEGDSILDVKEWEGSERGPYELLGFNVVPNNIMPLAPVAQWTDIHDLSNRVFRKLGRQADRQKTVTGYKAGREADASRVRDANDGEMIRMDDPSSVAEFKMGGIDQASMAFSIALKDLFNWQAGNLDIIGGLSPASDTAKQDEMMGDSASKRFQDMQAQTVKFATANIRKLAKYLWDDPIVEIPITKEVEGLGIEIETAFIPSEMPAEFMDYNISIEPYSLQVQTPNGKFNSVMEVINQVYMPLLPLMEQQGAVIDLEELSKLIADYKNLPELTRIIKFQNQQSGPAQPTIPRRDGAPAFKHNINERINRPGATRAGNDATMVKTLLGIGSQDSEMSAMSRSPR